MTNYPKSPMNLGAKVYEQFCLPPGAVVPRLQQLLANTADFSTEGRLAEVWGVTEDHLTKSMSALADVLPGSLHHTTSWGMVMRVAQCLALADRRMNVSLVPALNPGEDAHTSAAEAIRTLGQQALSLAGGIAAKDYHDWNQDELDRVAALCIKPHVFGRALGNFAEATASQDIAQRGPARALYRMYTAATLLGHDIQIGFVPFDQPYSESMAAPQ